MNIGKLGRSLARGLRKNAPTILTILGVGGMVSATVMAVKATPTAMEQIKEKKKELKTEDITPVETVKATWRTYAPAAGVAVMSVACIMGAHNINHRRNAALAAAYTMAGNTLKSYQHKVVEKLGEKQADIIKHEVTKEKVAEKPAPTVVVNSRDGNIWCLDSSSGRYFRSTKDKLLQVQERMNVMLRDVMYFTLNDLYYEMSKVSEGRLDPTTIGDYLEWDIDRGNFEFEFDCQLDPNGTPCLLVGYSTMPKYAA